MKKLSYVLIFIISLFFIGNVLALDSFPSVIHTGNQGAGLTISGSDNSTLIENAGSCSGVVYPCFHVKTTKALNGTPEVGNVVCVSGAGVNPPGTDIGYKKVNWSSDEHKRGVAHIINTVIGEGGSPTPTNYQYYWTEVLINAYLGTNKYSAGQRLYDHYILTGKEIVPGKSFNKIIEEAKAYASADYSVSLEASSMNLTFTKGSDGYYSSTITITSNTNISLGIISNKKFTITNAGDRYTFRIKDEDIANGGTETFEVKVSNSGKEYYIAQKYTYNGENPGYQDLTLTQTIKETIPGKELTLSGSVSKESISIKIGKKDSNKKFVSGATLMFQTKEQYDSKIDGITITTKNEYFEVLDIQAGTYYLTELEAPKGYDKTDKVYQIVVASDGSIKVDGKAVTSNEIDVTNDLTETVISKVSVVTNKELPGATLQILNDKKEKMSCVILDEKGKKQTLKECSWVSGEKPIEVVGLAKGKYYLVETIAPKGYVLNETAVEFEVKADGTTTNVVMKNDLEVEVPDTLSSRSALLLAIAMFDIALGIGIVTYVKKNKIEE